jgi:hypothetical protein
MVLLSLVTEQFTGPISQFSTAISYVDVNNSGSTISKSGNYYLTGNVSFYPVNTPTLATIIHITQSNVTLNLNETIISQASNNSTLNLNAIVIDPGLHHITIFNGTISGISGIGVVIGDGCSDIAIQNMQMTNCVQGGLVATGTSNDPILSLKLENLALSRNNGDPSIYGDNINTYNPIGASLTYTQHFEINSCQCVANQTTTNDNAYGLYLEQCSNGIIIDSLFSGNESNNAAYGVYAQQCIALEIGNSKFSNNVSLTYNAYGCALFGSSNNKIYKSQALSNIGQSLTYGFSLQGIEIASTYYGSNYNSILECNSSANYTNLGDSYGYFSSGNIGNNFVQSTSQGNQSGTQSDSLAAGFYAQRLTEYSTDYDETLTVFKQCLSKANYAKDSNGIGAGILIRNVGKAHIENNWVLSNTGGLLSYGIVDLSDASDTLIMSNYAFGHTTNYLATYEDPNARIPVISGTVGDFSTIANATPFINFEWRNNCDCYNSI